MKKSKVKAIFFLALLIVLAGMAGCVKTPGGQVALDPNAVAKIETGAETAVSVLTVLGAIWPALIPVVTAAGGIIGTWKVVKPQLVAEQSRSSMYYHVVESAVKSIEDFKAADPDKWAQIEEKYWTGVIGKDAENVIRALRNLPLKD